MTKTPALRVLRATDEEGNPFRLGSREYDWHSHPHGQLFCVENGLVYVRTPGGHWLLPPGRAGWIPPGMPHRIEIRGALRGWVAKAPPQACASLPVDPRVLGISDLMRELIRRISSWPMDHTANPAEERLLAVLLDEIRLAPVEPLHLPLPQDARLSKVAKRILEHPGESVALAGLAAEAGLSERNARRLFLAETGMKFIHWRQQARLCHAMARLAEGAAVAAISDELGYASPSNFIALFRRAFGVTPARFAAQERPAAQPEGQD
ncbi:helix-turn-helix domain-containing protein [Chromobacterium sp. IIBBL 290-4]|uniref:AraC family transcriptional regulator n=1 Tax=Chromobacterium sp. IIBBL 290-4 TaxID=2953890 RepID=UPI0020B7A264|nr:helix-turn-helix transcriptional regulator [Chromobacterium sp. IIBBL 290-4]UTH73736.1 helix-turn-helix transcriptional regulator [Chromobacterium sp. IIBBL 290-4]